MYAFLHFCNKLQPDYPVLQLCIKQLHVCRSTLFILVRVSNAVQCNAQDMEATSANLFKKRHRIAARPEVQAAQHHGFNFPDRLSPPSHGFS